MELVEVIDTDKKENQGGKMHNVEEQRYNGIILPDNLFELDALPYIDKEYEHPEIQSMVHKLIEEEMRKFSPKDYLAHLPKPPDLNFASSAFLKSEMERISLGKLMNKIDTSRYRVEQPPKQLEKDFQAWKGSLNNARAQLEYQNSQLLNMEMLDNFGASMWLAHNQQLEDIKTSLDIQVKARRKDADIINMKRKSAQEKLLPQLVRTSQKRDELVNSNLQVTKGVELLRLEVKRMRYDARRLGITEGTILDIASGARREPVTPNIVSG